MAPTLIIDLSSIDLNKVVVPIEEIRKVNAQRFEMEMLSSIVYLDKPGMTAVGVKHIKMDDFWVRGHIPGRPLMPGVMMIEAAAQLCSFVTLLLQPEMGFLGFVKCDDTRFRGSVQPPDSVYFIAKLIDLNRRRAVSQCQGIHEGQLIFESVITGMSI